MANEKPSAINLGQFWTQFRMSNGELISEAVFDDIEFTAMFGNEATAAYVNFADSTGSPPHDEAGRRMLETAIITLKTMGIAPEDVRAAKKDAKIEDFLRGARFRT